MGQKRAALHTLGCRLNQSETTLIEERLREAGYTIVPFGEPADVGIINTCTVTREADAKSRQLVRRFIKQNPAAYTAVIGCYSQMGSAALARIDGVDLILGNQEKLNVVDYVATGKNGEPLIVRDRIERDDFTIEVGHGAELARRANLKIQDGCNFMCAFCIIPFARGRARSRAMGNLLDEARQLLDRGARELVLTGVNIGCYEYEGLGIVDVCDRLATLEGLDRLRISSIEPTTIPTALFDRMNDAEHPLAPYLHIPLQAGSDAVLERMKRRYTRAEFLDFITQARAEVPEIGIGTDVLAGMPGESDADFEQTCAVLREGPIDYAHVFKYSERPGTASCRMDDKVAPDVVSRRAAVLRRISQQKRRRFQEAQLGRTMSVLFESADGEWWTGYTANYIRVAARSDQRLENCIRPVRLEAVEGDIVTGALA